MNKRDELVRIDAKTFISSTADDSPPRMRRIDMRAVYYFPYNFIRIHRTLWMN